jgi:oligopeptide transport system substrate-binding protein
MVVVLWASRPGWAQPPTPIPQDTYVMALNGPPLSFDPADVVRITESRVSYNLFEGLYMPPRGEGPAVPGVATRYEVSEEGLVYTFHLRDDARWSNGDPVTAGDFVVAWRRVLEPGSNRDYAFMLHTVENGLAYNEGSATADQLGVTAIDDHTLQVRLEEPVPFFVELTAFCTLFPVHSASVEALGDEAFAPANLVTNGAFQLESYTEGSALHLTPNPHYWDRSEVQLEHVWMRVFEDESEALDAYLAGEVEWLGELPWGRLSSLRFRNDFHTYPMFGSYYFRVNVTDPVFNDPRVRQALSLAIDRDALCRHVLDELCEPAHSFVPPMVDFEPIGALAYNPERARDLLAEAGYPDGAGFPAVRLLYNQLELHQRIVEAIVEMWRSQLGIEVELIPNPWDTYMQALEQRDYHVARFGWIGDYLDPDAFLYLMVSQNVQMNGGWVNDSYDQLIREAGSEQDRRRRFDLYRAAEAILLNELPVIPLFYYTQYHLLSPHVGGFEMNVRDVHLAKYIYKQ